MAVSHVKSNTVPDWTGTVTVGNSTGGTQTIAATDLVRPGDWNSAHNQYYTLSGNTLGSSTASGTNVVFAASGGVSLQGSNDTIIVSAPNPVTRTYFNPQDGYVQVAGQQGNASMHMQPMYAPDVTFDRIVMPMNVTNATNSTGTLTVSVGVGFYTRNDSTFSLMASTSGSFAVTFSGTVNNSTYSGLRLFTIPMSSEISEGQYYVGIWSRSTSGGANGSVSQFLASQANSNFVGYFGSAVNATMQYTRGLGHYSATFSTALPNSVGVSQLQGTQSVALRQPVFYMVNGTF